MIESGAIYTIAAYGIGLVLILGYASILVYRLFPVCVSNMRRGGKERLVPQTVLSFYCDDTNPYVAPPAAFATFLDFVRDEGIAGESTVLLGYEAGSNGLLSRPGSDVERSYIIQLQRAYSCGIDTHMELMTHGGLFDFGENRIPVDAIHEGVWLFEPGVVGGRV